MGEAMSWCLPWQPGVPADGAIMPVPASVPAGARGPREDAPGNRRGMVEAVQLYQWYSLRWITTASARHGQIGRCAER